MSEISYEEVETTDIDDTSSDVGFDSDLPDDSGKESYASELPDDSGKEIYDSELPDDSGKETYDYELPDDSGKETYDSELPDDLCNEYINFEKANANFEQIQEINSKENIDKPNFLLSEDIKNRTPENHGEWSGERGNSTWNPDRDYIPPEKSRNPEKHPYSNPAKLSWGGILDKYKIEGIEFKDGFPIFDKISRGTVEINDFETGGNDAKVRNFKRADIAMAEQRNCSPEEVEKWREENNYTWHECDDKCTMQKVQNEVHANIPHDGGRSQ